jgi:2-polyprenyl-3-methyl-5-hydroxy-6-metoxy-1,4-benzoquinol methylase
MRRSNEKELMDYPDPPRDLLEGELRNLRILNRYLGGFRCATHDLGRLVRRHRLAEFSLLDVGAGSADIASEIARWARSKGLQAKIVALDIDPVAAQIAAERVRHLSEITVVRGDAAAPPFATGSFDFVLASQFMHHFSEEKNVELLRTWSTIARRAIIVSDLVRHPLAYHAVRCLTRLWTRNIMTLTDAPRSVARSFTLAEWREIFLRAAIGKFQLVSVFPFRILGRLDV